MADRMITQSDELLQRLDKRFGLDASFTSVGAATTTPGSGKIVRSDVVTDNIKVRSKPLTIRDLDDLSRAGLQQVDTRWGMRKAYVDNIKAEDLLSIDGTGFTYVVLQATLDQLQLDWLILTRRQR